MDVQKIMSVLHRSDGSNFACAQICCPSWQLQGNRRPSVSHESDRTDGRKGTSVKSSPGHCAHRQVVIEGGYSVVLSDASPLAALEANAQQRLTGRTDRICALSNFVVTESGNMGDHVPRNHHGYISASFVSEPNMSNTADAQRWPGTPLACWDRATVYVDHAPLLVIGLTQSGCFIK